MYRIIYFVSIFFLFLPLGADAQEAIDTYVRGRVVAIDQELESDDPLVPVLERFSQRVSVELITGPEAGRVVPSSYVPGGSPDSPQRLLVGQVVVLLQTVHDDGTISYGVVDHYRLPWILGVVGLFMATVCAFAGWYGVRSIVGLACTITILLWFVLPAIIAGHNPLVVAVLGSLTIATVSLYIAHGCNRRITIAVVSTIVTILVATGIAVVCVWLASLFGLGTEEAFYVQLDDLASINLRGLLLAGIIIGVLGVLDDITTAQTAAVEEIHRANPALSALELYRRGTSVGREHIVSLVNTLALAYMGAGLPLFLLFTQYQQPWWVVTNSEKIAEEIIRTLVGSFALVFAVPLTTAIASLVFGARSHRD